MNRDRSHFKRLPVLFALIVGGVVLLGVLASAGAHPTPADAQTRRTTTTTRPSTTTTTPPSTTTTTQPTTTTTQVSTTTTTPPTTTTTVAGTWKIVPSPNVGSGTYGNELYSVAAVSAGNVWAVGYSPDPSGTPLYIRRSLVEHWDGASWNVIPSPNPAGKPDVELKGVAAINANDIWAVGHSGDPSSIPYQTLTEHWNGSSWSIISSPSPGTYNGNDLTAVAALSSNDVWAVGWYQSGSTGRIGGALTMHWDGTAWTAVSNPSPATLNAVTAVSSNNVWAVGTQVILHWNGTSWSTVSFPLPPGNNPTIVLKGVSAVSANDIWAVGYNQWVYFSGYLSAPVTYHWNGTSWSLVYNAGTTNEYLNGVVAITANDVWGVGDNGQMQHWNGAAWSRVTSPYPGAGGRLNDVAAVSGSDIWSVGHYGDTNGQLTWVDRYTIP